MNSQPPPKELIQRLREHAALHADLAAHSDEQANWRDDLLTAARLLEQPRIEPRADCPDCAEKDALLAEAQAFVAQAELEQAQPPADVHMQDGRWVWVGGQ